MPHEDAAFSAGRAALLGAALAAGSEALFAAALDDRLHEPYRSAFLADVRADLPESALGVTLSGSGPTVIVWARTGGRGRECARRPAPPLAAGRGDAPPRKLARSDPVNVRFADCRYDLLEPRRAPARATSKRHIPGAAFVDLDADLSDLSIPPEVAGRHPLPRAEQFAAAWAAPGSATTRSSSPTTRA